MNFCDKKNKTAFKALQRIRKETEEIKTQISFLNEISYNIDSLYEDEDFLFILIKLLMEIYVKISRFI